MEQKIVYFHIPKCMGTSLMEVFKKEYGPEKVLSPATVYDYLHTPHERLRDYRVFAGHITRDCMALLPGNSRLMTVLRNPGRRLLSLYSYYQAFSEADKAVVVAADAASRMSFHDWLDSGIPNVSVETSNAMTRYFVPERFYVDVRPAVPKNMLAAAVNFLEGFEFIGFQEHQNLVADYMNRVFNLGNAPIPTLNVSHSEKIAFDPVRLRDFLHSKCLLDLELVLRARSLMTAPKRAYAYAYKTIYESDRALFEFFD